MAMKWNPSRRRGREGKRGGERCREGVWVAAVRRRTEGEREERGGEMREETWTGGERGRNHGRVGGETGRDGTGRDGTRAGRGTGTFGGDGEGNVDGKGRERGKEGEGGNERKGRGRGEGEAEVVGGGAGPEEGVGEELHGDEAGLVGGEHLDELPGEAGVVGGLAGAGGRDCFSVAEGNVVLRASVYDETECSVERGAWLGGLCCLLGKRG